MFETDEEKEIFASELPELLSNSYCPGDEDEDVVGEFVEYIAEFRSSIDPTDALAIIAKCLACGVCARHIMGLSETKFLEIPEINLELVKPTILQFSGFSKMSVDYEEEQYLFNNIKSLTGSFL